MNPFDKVQSSTSGKIKLKEAYLAAGFNQKTLAEKVNVSEDTIKRLLGTKSCLNGVERWQVEKICEVLKLNISEIIDECLDIIPTEFQNIITDKTKIFCGREFVFQAIEEFINKNQNGYFTIIGDAGMGKSAICAKYILNNTGTICFFNIRAEGKNTPDLFLRLIRQQLSKCFELQNIEQDDLSTLLTKASQQLSSVSRIIIAIDALDEVNQQDNNNLLNLPTILPEKVYFILTRRPFLPQEKRLNLSPNVPYQELDLRKEVEKSIEDIKEYIWYLLNDCEYKDGLQRWIEKQEYLSKTDFVNTIAAKSENNFMYLRWVLPAIATGFYNDKTLDKLPDGLQGYYYDHWRLMNPSKNQIKIIYVMSLFSSPLSREVIAKYSRQSAITVQEVLEKWAQFLQKQDNYQPPRYRFYHESFRDFLHRQDMVQAAGVSLGHISGDITDIMEDEFFDDDENTEDDED